MALHAEHPTDTAPRWPVLLPLTVAVLAAHVVLLTDGLPLWWEGSSAASPSPPVLTSLPDEPVTMAEAAPPPTAVVPVRSSTVRWIVPEPPAPPPPPPVKKPERPPPPPPAPEPVAVPEPLPEPEPEAAQAEWPPEEEMPETATEDSLAAAEPMVTEAQSETPPALPNELEAVPGAPQPVEAEQAPRAPTASGPPLAPLHLPTDGRLDYDVKGLYKGLNYNAGGQLTWRFEGERYEAQMTVKAFLLGSRVHTSVGRLTPQGLAPERFGDRSRSERAAHFDYETQRIRYSRNSPDAALVPGTQDQLSVSFQLAMMLQSRPGAYAEGDVITLPVSNASYTEDWRFQVGPVAELELPAGTLSARLLTRPPRREFDKSLQVWLAPGLGYLPVRLRLTEHNGDFVDQLLGSMPAFQLPAPPAFQPPAVQAQ